MTSEQQQARATARLAELAADEHGQADTAEMLILRAVIDGAPRADLAAQLADVPGALAAVDAAVGTLILTMNDFLELHEALFEPLPWPFDTPPPPPSHDALVRRATERLARIGSRNGEVSPEETILRAFVEGTDRDALVQELSVRTYDFPEYAPFPHEGKTSTDWDDVEAAVVAGYLTEGEYRRIHAAVKPPAAQ